jgi:hypothetical protein
MSTIVVPAAALSATVGLVFAIAGLLSLTLETEIVTAALSVFVPSDA